MNFEFEFDNIPSDIKKRISPFLNDLKTSVNTDVYAAYIIGAAARGEFSNKNPEIQLLLVFQDISADLIESIAKLGSKFGRKGIHAPLLLTKEYFKGARDVFPLEFLDLRESNIYLGGEKLLENIEIDNGHLRIQVERELRSWRLRLRQAYLRSAADAKWMSGWFMEVVPDVFPVFRAALNLLDGDIDCGNTEICSKLEEKTGISFEIIVQVWENFKQGKTIDKDQVRKHFDAWDQVFGELVGKVDAL